MRALALVFLAGCFVSTPDPSLTPERVGQIAAEIRADPDKAEAILEGAGVDQDAFEARLYEIAEDPDATEAYLTALDGE